MRTKNTEILAVIPARSGSKGIPNKNIMPIGNKPLMAHSIEQALSSTLITRTILATDSEQYASIGKKYGAEVPFLRPPEVSNDLTTDLETFQYVLNFLKEAESYIPDIVVHLRPTSPIRTSKQIDECIELILNDPNTDSIRSLSESKFSPFKMWLISNDGTMKPAATCEIFEAYNQPRQILPKAYIHNGAIDVIRTKVITEMNSMSGNKQTPYIMDTCYDIDELEDFFKTEKEIATMKYFTR